VLLGMATVVVCALVLGAPVASAEPLAPWWGVTSGSQPTNLLRGQPGRIVVTAENRGDADTSGEVTISDRLPAGLAATAIEAVAGEGEGSGNRGPVSCELTTLTCTFSGSLHPYEEIEVDIAVSVGADTAGGAPNTATVSGGAAAGTVSASHAIEVGGTEKFGLEDYELIPENAGGSVESQAGSHPFQLTSVLTLNTAPPAPGGGPRTVALVKDIGTALPAGLIADPAALAQCTEAQFHATTEAGGCPAQSAVGVATATIYERGTLGLATVTTPIFDIAPLAGEPARFAVDAESLSVFLNASIRSGGDYGVTLSSENITQAASLLSLKLTFWGVPGDPRHDGQRGRACLTGSGACTPPPATAALPFLTLGTSCAAPFQSTARADSWAASGNPSESEQAEPATYTLRGASGEPLPLGGCGELPFAPEVTAGSERTAASTPSGLHLAVHVPQPAAGGTETPAASAIRDIAIALPAGVTLNPAAAGGLEACSESEIGFTGFGALDPGSEPGAGTALFTPALPEPLEAGLDFCPDASKLGTVRLTTPILPNALEGAVYLAAENANPYGSLAAIYILARDPVSEALVKLAGNLSLNQATGQIAVTFESTPQLPFEAIEMSFFGGERALLATPARCGSYTTDASFTPWSGGEPVGSQASFQITSGPGAGGGACPGPSLPFAPSLAAETTNIDAGSYSPFTMTLSRDDGQQALGGFALRLPPGLSGMLASVPLCPEAQANAGTCPASSQIGATTVAAGLGADPYTLEGGRVYLTGPYSGAGPCTPDQPSTATQSSSCAPFGLAIVTPVKAGPLDLENAPENHPACDCLVIRAKIEVDPRTAQLTIATGTGTGTSGIPSIVDGIPLQIKRLNITIDRAGFIFNPTNCNKMAVTSTMTGDEGASSTPSEPFQLANCKSLKFAPKLTVSTQGKTSEANGASLAVKLTFPKAPQGIQADLGAVKIDLPKQLPSRLTTLQQACLAKTFAANPANCPAASVIGHATVDTPILPGKGGGVLTGPAYFVSHGRETFPSVELVLQGDGVTIDLGATTFINKKDITSVTFKTLPDVPVSSFELTLPEGKYSALGTTKNLCKLAGKLKMPTALTGQNGAEIHGSTKVGVTGCPKAHKAKKKSKKRVKRTKKKSGEGSWVA
jgi:hypothetical protein